MASSILTGERRWVSARRGGMTVLGKVTVPKPVNLPSQRLENHGLDPNVEIVPKGTLSWGSRSSAPGVNAWGSTPLPSPSTEGSAGSPNRLNARPSSGGSGTRPSTAGSDKFHEPTLSSAWGPSSRPSSSSGALASSHTSLASSRPRSAETRPGSSQLSRFAEPSADNSVAWWGTSERLGTASSKIDGFTLSSGDFPSLGSDKNPELQMRQGHSSQGRPASSGAAAARERSEMSSTEDGSTEASTERGTVNTWKRDNSPYQGGAPPSTEKWLRDPQQAQPYPNMNMPHHQSDKWHAAQPVRSPPEGGWFRGGPPVGPYGPTGPPGGYPLDPLAYFHSQMAARPVSYPRPGGGPSGYPNNGELYHPHMSDSYMVPTHPVIPIRPGSFPAPVPYDGYYGPPHLGYCNTDECDASAMGSRAGSGAYNTYPNLQSHPDSSNFHVRPGGYGPNPVAKEQMESGLGHNMHHNTHQGPYKVLLKQQADWSEKDAEDKREHSGATSTASFDRMNPLEVPTGENNWGTDASNDEPMDFSKPAFGEDASFKLTKDCGKGTLASIAGNEPEKTHSAKSVGDSSLKEPEIAAEHMQVLPGAKKFSTLIDKIEGLHSMARASDGRYDVGPASAKEKPTRFKSANAKADPSTKDMAATSVSTEKSTTSDVLMRSSNKTEAPTEDKSSKLSSSEIGEPKQFELQASGVRVSEIGEKAYSQNHKRSHDIQHRADYRIKGRVNTQEGEEWRRKAPGADSASATLLMQNSGASSDALVQVHHDANHEGPLKHKDLSTKVGGEPYASSSADPSNYKAQRAKRKEIATQHTKQLQREEEERSRQQKAKADAKLEELNRQTQAESSTHLKMDQPLQHKPEETSQPNAPSKTDIISSGEVPGHGSSPWESSQSSRNTVNPDTQTHSSEKSVIRLGESTFLYIPVEVSSDALQSPRSKPANSSAFLPLDNACGPDPASQRTAQVFGDGVIKQKHMGHKRRQNISQENNLGDHQIITGGTRIHRSMAVDANASSDQSSLANSNRNTDDAFLVLKKKNNRSAKSKHKSEEPLVGTGIPVSAPMGEKSAKALVESGKHQAPEPVLEGTPAQTRFSKVIVEGADSHNVVASIERGLSQPSEEAHGRANEWKSQPPRRTSRSTQVIRPAEKFHGNEAVVWAPVRPLSKSVPSEDASQIINGEGSNSSAKNMHGVQNNLKIKRAEIERYVAKPVAKELLQQGNSQQPASVCHPQTVSDITSGKTDVSQSAESSGQHSFAAGKMEVALETKNSENKHNNRHGKPQALWRQRGSTESSHVTQISHEGTLPPSEQSKSNQKAFDLHQPSKPDMSSPKEQAKYSEHWSNSLMPTEPATGASFMKDHGTLEKGKKPPQKVQRGGANNHTAMGADLQSGTADELKNKFLADKSTEPDGKIAMRNESQGGGEHTVSYWQLKSPAYPAQSRQGSRASDKVMRGQRNAGQVARAPEKEFSSKGTGNLSQRADKGWNARVQPSHQFDNQNPNATETTNVRVQEAGKERKGQEQVSATNLVDHVPCPGADSHQEQPVSFGQQQHGQQNGRFHGGPEAPYAGSSWGQGQETIKQQMPGNGDRPKHSSHFEYQPVRFQKPSELSKQNPSIGEETLDGFQGGRGSRYRERGQNHGRRGSHFYGRNGGGAGARVAVSYGNG